eukprot:jgi/Bigna1/128694/aug1.7_g3402
MAAVGPVLRLLDDLLAKKEEIAPAAIYLRRQLACCGPVIIIGGLRGGLRRSETHYANISMVFPSSNMHATDAECPRQDSSKDRWAIKDQKEIVDKLVGSTEEKEEKREEERRGEINKEELRFLEIAKQQVHASGYEFKDFKCAFAVIRITMLLILLPCCPAAEIEDDADDDDMIKNHSCTKYMISTTFSARYRRLSISDHVAPTLI